MARRLIIESEMSTAWADKREFVQQATSHPEIPTKLVQPGNVAGLTWRIRHDLRETMTKSDKALCIFPSGDELVTSLFPNSQLGPRGKNETLKQRYIKLVSLEQEVAGGLKREYFDLSKIQAEAADIWGQLSRAAQNDIMGFNPSNIQFPEDEA